jgi:hypothetical protein
VAAKKFWNPGTSPGRDVDHLLISTITNSRDAVFTGRRGYSGAGYSGR